MNKIKKISIFSTLFMACSIIPYLTYASPIPSTSTIEIQLSDPTHLCTVGGDPGLYVDYYISARASTHSTSTEYNGVKWMQPGIWVSLPPPDRGTSYTYYNFNLTAGSYCGGLEYDPKIYDETIGQPCQQNLAPRFENNAVIHHVVVTPVKKQVTEFGKNFWRYGLTCRVEN